MAKAVPIRTVDTSVSRGRWPTLSKQLQREVVPRLVLWLMCAFFLVPLFWMVIVALKSNAELSAYPPTLLPQSLRWANFSDAVETIPFWKYLKNTSIITALTIVGSAISNPIVAYGFSRIDWPGRDKLFYFVLATVFIPYPVLIIALFDIFAKLQWVNTYWPLVVPLWFGNAFWIFLMRQFFMQIPKEISDAAKLDGASELRILFQVILPQSYAALGAVSLFAALHAWNDFLGPLLYLQDENKYTLAVGLTFFRSASQYDVQFNLLMAASILVVMPVVVLFFLFQRWFVEGVTVGSFK